MVRCMNPIILSMLRPGKRSFYHPKPSEGTSPVQAPVLIGGSNPFGNHWFGNNARFFWWGNDLAWPVESNFNAAWDRSLR
jgi:hypothetical protein